MKYEIVRYFGPDVGKPPEVQRRNLTLEEAQKHCSDPSAEGDGWFDGYREQQTHRRPLNPRGIPNMLAGITGDHHHYNNPS